MDINNVIIYIMAGFMTLGAIDYCMGNKMGLGDRFKEAFMAMGPLTLAMVGIVSLSPVLAAVVLPVIGPIYKLIGADPSSFANTLLALDMGGYALAQELAQSPEAGLFAWVFLGTMMGPTFVFTIPVALGIIDSKDRQYFAKGILLGIITVPIGCLVGGLLAGFSLQMILLNLFPTMLISLSIAFGLWKVPASIMKAFTAFGKLVQVVAIFGLVAIIFETLTGIIIIPGMIPLDEGIRTVGRIAIVLAGAFPMVTFLNRFFRKSLARVGTIMGISETAATGLLASLAHHIPMFALLKEMDPRGKVMNAAFSVSGAFVFGSHLGFVAGINKELVFAMVVGKLVAGLTAVVLAGVTTARTGSDPALSLGLHTPPLGRKV